jgi:transcriptional antiterminator Rof (Rho-off)
MQEIQQHRERIKNISLKCNVQYFVWKRWIEKDMLKGYLARVEYIKPAIKQEGLVMEHMRDLEFYYAQLEALYNNCYKVEKTLEAAYDTLSRRVSICMELKTGDRYERSASDIFSNKADVRDEYDKIQEGETATKGKKGFVGWE